jgi:hypothetical protein
MHSTLAKGTKGKAAWGKLKKEIFALKKRSKEGLIPVSASQYECVCVCVCVWCRHSVNVVGA